MKILHISRQFYPCIGGVEKYIYEISKRLVKKGIKCRVLTLNYNIFEKKEKFFRYEEMDGIEIYRIPGFGYYKKPIPLNFPLKLFRWADIIHIHDLRFLYETTLLLKQVLKYRIIWSTHGFLLHTEDFKFLKSFAIPVYYKPSIKNFIDGVICISKQDFEYFKNWQIKNLYLIENGIDFEKFSKIKRNPQKGKFLYFGRIDTNKGLDLLLRTLSLMKNDEWHLDIIGSGFDKVVVNLKNLSKELGISGKITWHGFLSEDKLFDFLGKAQFCFFPSKYEGFGFTLLEAMASGCVCIANTITAYKDIVNDNKNAFLVNFFDPEEASVKIHNLLNNSQKVLENIGQNAKEKAKEYSWEEKINQIIEIYQKVLK